MRLKIWIAGKSTPIETSVKNYMIVMGCETLDAVKADLDRKCADFESDYLDYEIDYSTSSRR